MSRFIWAVVVCLAVVPAMAHKATERYIPIGQSPGLSHKYTYIGEIQHIESASHAMTMVSPRGMQQVRMSNTTRIYLDRSSMKKTNLTGTYADCRSGRRIEVKFRDNDPESVAEWIKVEITQ